MTVRCPKCRSLGSAKDCADQLIHEQASRVNDDEYELEVQLRFAVPVTSQLVLDPVQMAAYMRERWLGEDEDFDSLIEALTTAWQDQDVDVIVAPVFTS